MYRVRTPSDRKSDPLMRWSLPDRVFFACGACHILAAAHLDRFGEGSAIAVVPAPAFTGSHVVVGTDRWAFDDHGYAEREGYFAHVLSRARRWWPGWDAALVPMPRAALTSEAASRLIPGLRLREPGQFLHDPRARARADLDRSAHPPDPIRLRRGRPSTSGGPCAVTSLT